jgi:hypothetical protein
MSAITNKKALVLAALCLLLLIKIYPAIRDNILGVFASKALFASSSTSTSTTLLRQVMQKACNQPSCEPEAWASNEAVIKAADRFFIDSLNPLIVVENSVEIPAASLLPSGQSTANQETPNSGTLYSKGYFQLRVFLASESVLCWRFGVRAMHDDPPPVNLALWLDNEELGELSFTRGDQSWENLSLTSSVRPGVYWLRVWFINDYLDRELNADRNAYLESIHIEQVEEALCADR